MKAIPLTRARHAANFVIALKQKGAPVERYLSRSHLPVELQKSTFGNNMISAVSMLDFADKAALGTGILDLGYWAGTVPIEEYGEFGRYVAQASSLYDAIQTFCGEVRGECSAADYYLAQNKETAWFCHGPVGDTPFGLQQHELYALTIMRQVIQLALGSDWHPGRIRLQATNESALSGNDLLLSTNIEFGAPVTAIEVPIKHLATPLLGSVKTIFSSKEAKLDESSIMQSNDPLVALHKLISSYIQQSKQPTIEIAAEMIGVNKRTLQRFLSSKAMTYSSLVDQVRFNLALPLLKDESVTITEISYELGYSNVAHFSRAFRRITGMPPKAYRHMLKQ